MGTKRVEGKKKIKSIKAKVTSRSGQKKKLSRMGKKVKKGEMGQSADFMTRSAVLKKLQITLKDFRRLCILKGIYPRVPNKPPKGADKVYYDIKDIAYLNHEPLLFKFREFKSFMKKVRKEAGRYQFADAKRRHDYKPVIKLDHLVKERYPRFIDALRDLDDALCMVHLFASLPAVGRITAERVKVSSEIVKHWQYYVARSRCLSKVFVSVKGTYFQAEILGEKITWLTPHPFTQIVPREVDMRVMLTFLEFYEVFLKFVLFKLYNMQGLRYPPVEDPKLHTAGCFLLSVKVQPLEDASAATAMVTNDSETAAPQASENKKHSAEKLKSLAAKLDDIANRQGKEEEDGDDDDDSDDENVPVGAALNEVFDQLYKSQEDGMQEEDKATFSSDSDEAPKIFSKFKFFINREVPLPWMQLCVISHGGQIGWDHPSSPFNSSDPSITHHVIDRPLTGAQVSSREYVQPQWVFDCINAQTVLPTSRYRPGAILPPHLSPFVDDDKEGYIPKYREELKKLKSAVEVNSGNDDVPKSLAKDDASDDEDEDYQTQVRKEKKGSKKEELESDGEEEEEDNDDSEGDDDSDEEEEESDASSVDEKDFASKKGPKGVVFKPKQEKVSEDQEVSSLNKIMMSRKVKRLYDNMQHSNSKKKESLDKLNEKRKRLEEEESGAAKAQAKAKPPAKKAKKN